MEDRGLQPPFRYGIVVPSVYRGAYPTLLNLRFLRLLRLKTMSVLSTPILCLSTPLMLFLASPWCLRSLPRTSSSSASCWASTWSSFR